MIVLSAICFAEFVFSLGKVGRTVIGASLIDSFYPLRLDLKKLYSASAVLAFAKKFCKENIDCSDVFLLAIDALKNIAYGKKSEQNYLAEFLCKALSVSGFGIDFSGCHECLNDISDRVYFDYRTGGFYCEQCFDGQGREVLLETYHALKSVVEDVEKSEKDMLKGLKLLEYYIENRIDVSIEPLKELIKLCSE